MFLQYFLYRRGFQTNLHDVSIQQTPPTFFGPVELCVLWPATDKHEWAWCRWCAKCVMEAAALREIDWVTDQVIIYNHRDRYTHYPTTTNNRSRWKQLPGLLLHLVLPTKNTPNTITCHPHPLSLEDFGIILQLQQALVDFSYPYHWIEHFSLSNFNSANTHCKLVIYIYKWLKFTK